MFSTLRESYTLRKQLTALIVSEIYSFDVFFLILPILCQLLIDSVPFFL